MTEGTSPAAITVHRVSKHFPVVDAAGTPRRFTALEEVSLEVATGECLLLSGANGSGKTLLMHIIAGLESASSGEVTAAGRVGLVFQDADSQLLGETPREDLVFSVENNPALSSQAASLHRKERRRFFDDQALAALEAVGLGEKADFPARQLSGGEKRRLAVAGVLAQDAATIIFDEPYANLDYPGVQQVNGLIGELRRAGKTLVLLTHELEKCLGLADRIAVLYQGRKVLDCTPAEALPLDLGRWGIHSPGEGKLPSELVWR
jgi:biotin transport system ATP-binding protein